MGATCGLWWLYRKVKTDKSEGWRRARVGGKETKRRETEAEREKETKRGRERGCSWEINTTWGSLDERQLSAQEVVKFRRVACRGGLHRQGHRPCQEAVFLFLQKPEPQPKACQCQVIQSSWWPWGLHNSLKWALGESDQGNIFFLRGRSWIGCVPQMILC